jgi:hypothetical protein
MKDLVRTTFKNSKGTPFELTDGQAELFAMIYKRKWPRNHIQTPTRYGKSEVISMAILSRVAHFPEKWAIVAGNKDKARIIMSYLIGHIFDNDFIHKKFSLEKGESEENIRRYKNKDRINFKVGNKLLGEVFITTAEGALGFGASNIVEDESGLIQDNEHALVMRMLGDQTDNFLCKVGNPWDVRHFRKSYEDSKYKKFIIDYYQAVREGRLTSEYVEEMRKQPFFDVLYECKFPPEGAEDSMGWSLLVTPKELDLAIVDDFNPFGIPSLGADPSGEGDNESVVVVRWRNVAKIEFASSTIDSMDFTGQIAKSIETYKVDIRACAVDKVGPGEMLPGKMKEIGKPVQGINVGEACDSPENQKQFINKRAELAWAVMTWIKGGGKLLRDSRWYQILNIKYKVDEKGRLKIMSKDDMRKNGITSPDAFDALALTFSIPQIFYRKSFEQEIFDKKMKMNATKNKTNKNYKMTSY